MTVSVPSSDLAKSWGGGSVTVTRVLTRQGCTVGSQYRLLLMWARALLIATCHVTHVKYKWRENPIYIAVRRSRMFKVVSVPREVVVCSHMKVPDDYK